MANSNHEEPGNTKSRAVWHEDLIEYLANPLDKRSFEAFAESIGVSHMTVFRYRKLHRDEISREVESIRKKFLSEGRNKAYKALYAKFDKDTNAIKLFFQLAGDLIERSENRTEILSPEDKKARIEAALTKLLDEAQNSGQKDSSSETKES